MVGSQIGSPVLLTQVAGYLAQNPRRESEPGLGLLSLSCACSENPHPVTQLPYIFSHARVLCPFQTYSQQISGLCVIEPLLMEDLAIWREQPGHCNDNEALLLGSPKQRFDFREARTGAAGPSAAEVHFDLDPPKILGSWFVKLGLCLSK